MPYIGKSPVGGGFHKLDALTASATATYALTLGSAAYFPETANQLLVSLNGVIQAPQDSFTVSGSNLVFDTALTSSDSIDFVVALGDVLGVGSVSDGAVTTNKIGNGAVTKAKMGTTELDLATIKDSTGTNTAITIDSSGNVTPDQKLLYGTNQPMFSVRGQNGNASISGLALSNTSDETSTTYINSFSQIDVNRGSLYSNGRLVAPVDGVYEINARNGHGSGSTTNRALIVIKVDSNGTSGEEIHRVWTAPDYSWYTLSYHGFLDLTAGEQIAVGWNTSYMPHTTSEHEGATVFSAKLIG
jgi:hypothetical protein